VRSLSRRVSDAIGDIRASRADRVIVDGLRCFRLVKQDGKFCPDDLLGDMLGSVYGAVSHRRLIDEFQDMIDIVLKPLRIEPRSAQAHFAYFRAIATTMAYTQKVIRDCVKYAHRDAVEDLEHWLKHACKQEWCTDALRSAVCAIPWEEYTKSRQTRRVAPIWRAMDEWLAAIFESVYIEGDAAILAGHVGNEKASEHILENLLLYPSLKTTLRWMLIKAPQLAQRTACHKNLIDSDLVQRTGLSSDALPCGIPTGLPAPDADVVQDSDSFPFQTKIQLRRPLPTVHIGQRPPEAWFADFMQASREMSRPVLLQGAGEAQEFSSEKLLQMMHAENVGTRYLVFDIPYADAFNRVKGEEMSLREYLSKLHALDYKSYFFSEIKYDPSFRFIDGILGRVPSVVAQLDNPQLGVGGKNTGAPVHFHKAAFNYCLTGSKHWYICPPENAIWSNQQIHDFLSDENATLFAKPEMHHVHQQAGDMVFIPHNWGHGVLNYAEQTVAVAQEVDFLGIQTDDDVRLYY